MTHANVIVPTDFRAIRGNLPPGLDRDLGYRGSARFVAFWWHEEEDDVAWDDGSDNADAAEGWETWTRVIAPNAGYFQHHFGADLGGSDRRATHVFVWDRAQHFGYVVPRASAVAFLKENATTR